MESSDWLVTNQGNCEACEIPSDWEWSTKPYRLYRFLTDLEDSLDQINDERQLLQVIRPLVRRLLTSSYWLQGEYLEPNPDPGWSVQMIYDEINYPLTVQNVVWLPGKVSPIHNHGTWGVVAVISGQEKNTFWRRTDDPDFRDRIEQVGEKILFPGDIISFTSDAIHSVEAMGDEPTITFNIYGETNYDQRFEFDPLTHTAKTF
ncbi:cupin [Moorena producens JHB]|uniref:Cupin n=1 Tax=Moorena producens (strain JHB) TaxID=1454205 RepID=A0A1D9FY94_MOOP1|nr:cupin [Moorena producens]AOY80244.1 cupin [Moorena producens JHB]